MKRCPYCGNHYPVDTERCHLDNEVLVFVDPHQQVPTEHPIAAAASHPEMMYPEYVWHARDAWKCLAMVVALNFSLTTLVRALDAHVALFYRWHSTGYGYFLLSIAHSALSLLPAAYYARTETLKKFLEAMGLRSKPTDAAWFGVACALGIRAMGHFLIAAHWSRGLSHYDIAMARHTQGIEKWLYLLPVLGAAFVEEPFYRGFLYRAFRGSYPVVASTALVIAYTACTHWNQYSHSWAAVVDISLITVVQCWLRERTNSLWNCIICHFAFNASFLLTTRLG
jgi:membrane protease YdiL (CAAX protease family)